MLGRYYPAGVQPAAIREAVKAARDFPCNSGTTATNEQAIQAYSEHTVVSSRDLMRDCFQENAIICQPQVHAYNGLHNTS